MKRILLLSFFLLLSIIMNAQGWGQTQKNVPNDRELGDQFGNAVAIDGNYAVVGAWLKDMTSSDTGMIYIYEKDGNDNWNIIQTFSGDNQFDQLGYSVAIEGNYIIACAKGQDFDENDAGGFMNASGAVYIYENNGGTWSEVQKIVASDRGALNQFGWSISISGDYAIIGSGIQDYDESGNDYIERAGAAYIFEKDGTGTWNEVQKIVAPIRNDFDYFGRSVTIDGNYAVVGAFQEDEDASEEDIILSAGSAYIFERDGTGVWNQVQKIAASDREQGEYFGFSVALDGDNLVVGAEQEYVVGNTNAQYGAAYVFENNGNGLWYETQKIRASYLEHQSKFGQSVSIDNDHIIVGAYRTDFGSASDGGAAFMFNKDGTGIWSQVAVMYDIDANTSDEFGFSVSVSGDNAVVGAYKQDEDSTGMNNLSQAGSDYIFNVNEPNTLQPLNTLSVIDNKLSSVFKAYPNPNQGSFIIDLEKIYNQITISITNSLGQDIETKYLQFTDKVTLDVDSSSGLYFVTISTKEGISTVLKILKQ